MIGVVGKERGLAVAREFFELFKTPWEPAVPGRKYRVVLATSDELDHIDSDAFLLYGSGEYSHEHETGVKREQLAGPLSIEWRQESFPVYGKVSAFALDRQQTALTAQGKSIDYQWRDNGRVIWRIGYDLFDEVRYLLTKGQPAQHALTPTLELHIHFLRNLLIESRVAFVEIPPRPAGYDFICCLTHDIDFYGIRRHTFDRTMAGFLYRASIGSLIDLVRGRRSLAEAGRNWLTFCSLPLVLVGILPDFWRPFKDYAKVEDTGRSTFFLVPFRGVPGVAPDDSINAWRATPYGISDVREEAKRASSSGSELGIHGIDAWRDADAGREEMRQLTSLTGQKATGIRMHWLYFDERSPVQLEKAGFEYDSTWGYNEAVGYRAGAGQAFRPLGCDRLIELPMSIMDSALFSPGRMNLAREEALLLCRQVLAYTRRFGGTLVINWHERSLAPERLWGKFYRELLEEIRQGDRAWFAKAGEAVEWFRWRRSIRFHEDPPSKAVYVEVPETCSADKRAVVRIRRPSGTEVEIRDVEFNGAKPMEVHV